MPGRLVVWYTSAVAVGNTADMTKIRDEKETKYYRGRSKSMSILMPSASRSRMPRNIPG